MTMEEAVRKIECENETVFMTQVTILLTVAEGHGNHTTTILCDGDGRFYLERVAPIQYLTPRHCQRQRGRHWEKLVALPNGLVEVGRVNSSSFDKNNPVRILWTSLERELAD